MKNLKSVVTGGEVNCPVSVESKCKSTSLTGTQVIVTYYLPSVSFPSKTKIDESDKTLPVQ